MTDVRNPHAGEPFPDDSDATIAAALEDVSVPALLCSLVHMTGDPSWIRDVDLPRMPISTDIQGGLTVEQLTDIRRRAVPAIAAYRDGGCVPKELSQAVVEEMLAFLACKPLEGVMVPLFTEELQLDGKDSGAITWGDEVSAETKRQSPVVVIGCAMSGILAGIRLAQAGLPFVIIEKNAGPGGTWWENAYPGARVDVGSHFYCYGFEPSHHWTEYFCQQPELRDYFSRMVDEHGLRPHCRFNTEVTALTWDDATSEWRVDVRNPDGSTERLDARFVISAVGSLNTPRLPEIDGMDTFTGPSFHSARWPADLDITGTRFALVGAGASGFQIAPTIADTVAQLNIFQRTTQWMFPNPLYHEKVPAGDRWAMRHLPFYCRWFRFIHSYPGIGAGTDQYRYDPEWDDSDGSAVNKVNAMRRRDLEAWIRMNLEDRPDLIEKSIPNYPAMGKRILQDNGSWLKTLKKPNVDLIHTGIERIEPNGVRTVDGTLYEADVICYATGFRHNEFLATMSVHGRNGADLREQWGDEPSAYLGITIPNFPNLFLMYGPGTNLAHGGSLFFHAECQIHYAMDAIHQTLAGGARSIEVRKDVHDDYVQRHQAEIGQLVWSHPSIEHSHYKNPQGKIFTLSPWRLELYWEWTRAAQPDEYVLEK